ncbi:hypothetical protein [Yersinia rochesterensis]|uniref:hypothetical protein n=1 Tax=Yersinia rochesterensis TaxID=1604335 RepID=UPI0011A617B6|nr:hypothetical protein [Yersinia rochesterensis]
MSENTDYDKACREIARIAAALGIVDYSGDTSEIFDAIIIKDEKHQNVVVESGLLRAAARDMLSGWKEIRRSGGENEIYGIGWDRSQTVVELALNTPATTQALNEIKAQGVDELSEWSLKANDGFGIDVTPEEIALFAASLRGEHEIKS